MASFHVFFVLGGGGGGGGSHLGLYINKNAF